MSPYQANRGNELAKEQEVEDLCSFQVADALDQPFDDNTFDLIWSLESGEHMPDKEKFVNDFIAAWSKVMNLDRFDVKYASQ